MPRILTALPRLAHAGRHRSSSGQDSVRSAPAFTSTISDRSPSPAFSHSGFSGLGACSLDPLNGSCNDMLEPESPDHFSRPPSSLLQEEAVPLDMLADGPQYRTSLPFNRLSPADGCIPFSPGMHDGISDDVVDKLEVDCTRGNLCRDAAESGVGPPSARTVRQARRLKRKEAAEAETWPSSQPSWYSRRRSSYMELSGSEEPEHRSFVQRVMSSVQWPKVRDSKRKPSDDEPVSPTFAPAKSSLVKNPRFGDYAKEDLAVHVRDFQGPQPGPISTDQGPLRHREDSILLPPCSPQSSSGQKRVSFACTTSPCSPFSNTVTQGTKQTRARRDSQTAKAAGYEKKLSGGRLGGEPRVELFRKSSLNDNAFVLIM